MRFGCCAGIEDLRVVEQAGFDFVEMPAGAVLPFEDEKAFTAVARKIVASRLRPEAWNCFVPSRLPLVGPSANPREIDLYLSVTMKRIARVGGEVVVFGSGTARHVPDDWPVEKAHDQLIEFLSATADYADRYDLLIAIEPLRRAETNFINTYSEGARYAAEMKHPRIQALADLYHFDEDGETFDNIRDDGAYLAHVHLADSGRKAPGTGTYDYPGFLGAVADVGYDARISIECVWDDLASQAGPALTYLKEQWNRALT